MKLAVGVLGSLVIIVATSLTEVAAQAHYDRLGSLLRQQNWERAKDYTWQLIVQIGDRDNNRELNYEENDNFPCADLTRLMDLWRTHYRASSGYDDILIPRFHRRAVTCRIWVR
jgi:hypothetical protein